MNFRSELFQPLKASVRARLGLIQAILLASLLTVSMIAGWAVRDERASGVSLAVLSGAQRDLLTADAMHDALEADVNAALGTNPQNAETFANILASAHENAKRLSSHLVALDETDLPPVLRKELLENSRSARAFATLAIKVVSTAIHNQKEGLAFQSEFRAAFDSLSLANDESAALLDKQVAAAEAHTIREASRAGWLIATFSASVLVIACYLVAVIGRSIRISLGKVRDAARALAAGNLSVRSEVASLDEVGELAGAVNKMADELQLTIGRLLADADRDAFTAKITQALEMADSEEDVYGVVTRAMGQVSVTPMELLLADANRTSLKQVVSHPTAGAPGCAVESAANCAAVRRGSALVFEDSESLNACPRLRNRACGPISAACVPVSFMGRAFGVLHATGPLHKPPPARQVAQLTTLGLQSGARIGAVRALARTQLHAYTDSLTGLKNRRALDQQISDHAATGAPYAFALADLDRFKALNDTHGHDAGDQALRLFADVLKRSIRTADAAARWGGEEFCILFVGADAETALEIIDRIRTELAQSLLMSGGPVFTSSFGVADSTMGTSFEEILRIADEALYHTKNTGRDGVSIGPTRTIADLKAKLA
jgi:diguanylate cyclase (GGDEF)-like protein